MEELKLDFMHEPEDFIDIEKLLENIKEDKNLENSKILSEQMSLSNQNNKNA